MFFFFFFFFFNDTATTEIYTLSLHDALPISLQTPVELEKRNEFSKSWKRSEYIIISCDRATQANGRRRAYRQKDRVHAKIDVMSLAGLNDRDRKSTRLNSSHLVISYAVFCLK